MIFFIFKITLIDQVPQSLNITPAPSDMPAPAAPAAATAAPAVVAAIGIAANAIAAPIEAPVNAPIVLTHSPTSSTHKAPPHSFFPIALQSYQQTGPTP